MTSARYTNICEAFPLPMVRLATLRSGKLIRHRSTRLAAGRSVVRDDIEYQPTGQAACDEHEHGGESRISEEREPAFDAHHHRGTDNERGNNQAHSDAVGHFLKSIDHSAFVDDLDLQLQLAARERLEHPVDAARQLLGKFF